MSLQRSREFVLVGRSLAVDFINTELVEDGERAELLHSDADLFRWARAAGLPVAGTTLRQAGRDALDPGVRPLRAALRALFEAVIEQRQPSPHDLEHLNRYLSAARYGEPLIHRNGAFVRAEASIALPLSVLEKLADDAALILAGDDVHFLRRCANHHCILLFLDRSRTARRRWCSMEVCGNRAKVAAHHRRARGG